MRKFAFIFFIFLSGYILATHNRAGEITYSRVAPFTAMGPAGPMQVYNYTFTVTKYTNDGDDVLDRCEDTIYFGDGTFDVIPRTNGGASACPTCSPCDCGPPCGVLISELQGFRVKINIYTATHTYPGPGNYMVRSTDPMRNDDVTNMTNSGQVPFYIESLLIINSFTGANSSPVFTYLPTDKACVGKCFYHNPGAYDADGDSLSYEITTPRSSSTTNVPGYTPPNFGGGTYSIDPVSGILSWCSPQKQAVYNLAFIVKEWRKNTSKNYQLVGYVLRDMQVIVQTCTNNPPSITVPNDTCVEAGTLINKNIFVNDPEKDQVILNGNGGSFSTVSPKALLTNGTGIAPFTANFSWQTSCDHIRQQPYVNVFKAEDQNSFKLIYFATYNVKVVPPSVKNVSATPIGSTIKITWQLSNCNPAANPIISYNVYRKSDCAPFVYQACKTGIDLSSGFVLVGQTTSSVLIDNNGGNGLVVGQDYSYIIIAEYKDGSLSYASSQVCAKLKRDIPILLNVDILSTSVTNGSVYVRWHRPLKGPEGFDSIAFPGPYQFKLKYKAGNAGTFSTLTSFTQNFIFQLDTEFVHANVNTVNTDARYEVEFTAGTVTIGSSQKATSVFLSATPGDRKIDLQWAATTPWSNYKYTVYRKDPLGISFYTIATTSNTNYTDNTNVINDSNYCYKILSEGQYSDPTIFKPLLNNSHEVCAVAQDNTIPCTPTITITANCPAGFVKVEWNNVALTCSDDVTKYILYKKETIDEEYMQLDTLFGSNTISFTFDGLNLISSCFAIKAVDLNGNASSLSEDYCVDNCPEFELPNIITLNGDGVNDFFKAIKVRQIKEIDLFIFDRWGNLVYKTKDPYFNWNGISLLTAKTVSEGTFFYICDVFEPGIKGIKKRALKGYLQVVH